MSRIREIIETLPTTGTPTVQTDFLFNKETDHGLIIRVETDQPGTVTIYHSADGITASRTETYNIEEIEWVNESPLYDLYVSVAFTLTSGIDCTRFELQVKSDDTLPESLKSVPATNVNIVGTPAVTISGITLDNASSNILVFGSDLGGSGNKPIGTNEYGCICTTSNCITVTLPDGYTNVQEVERSCTGGYVTKVTMPYMYDGTSWNRQRGSVANGLNVYDASTISKLDDVNANLNVINTTLVGPLDVSAQTVTVQDLTAQARLVDINANVVMNGNTLLTIDTSLLNIDTSVDDLNTDVNANLAIINTTQGETNTRLDGVNANLALLGITTLNVDSNIQVNGNKLDAIDSNVQAVNTTLQGTLSTKNVDYTTSVYANSVTQVGQILVSSPISNGRIKTVLCASRTTDPIVFGIYDTGAIAPTASDTPILVIPMDAGTATMCYHFGDAGVTFNNGLGVRCQDNSGNFNINENNAVSSEVNVMSIVYSVD